MPKNVSKLTTETGTRRRGRLRARIFVWFCALVVGSGLAVIAYFVSWAASLATLTAISMFALVLVSRRARKDREATQSKMAELASERDLIIDALLGALGLRDMNMMHSEAVANLSAVVAMQMGLREDEVRRVRAAALLHDVGKMDIAESILTKAGSLDEDEMAAMRRHSEAGFQIIHQVPSLRETADVIRHHHERVDGQGYPQGLVGDEIPISSRIYAVVDSYVAMTSDRPYRKRMPHDLAVREIVRHSLTQFDTEVVEAFLQAERQGYLTPAFQPKEAPVESPVSTEV